MAWRRLGPSFKRLCRRLGVRSRRRHPGRRLLRQPTSSATTAKDAERVRRKLYSIFLLPMEPRTKEPRTKGDQLSIAALGSRAKSDDSGQQLRVATGPSMMF